MNYGWLEDDGFLTRIPRMLLPLGQILVDHALAVFALLVHVVQRGPAVAEMKMRTVPSNRRTE